MFTKINEGKIISSEGWEINLSYSHITYREGEKAVRVGVEHSSDPYLLSVSPDSIDRWYPPIDRAITEEEKKIVLLRLQGALDALGTTWQFE